MKKIKNSQPQTKFTGSYKKKSVNDLYGTICMTYNRLLDFHCVYTLIQVIHTEFIKVVRREYSAFKSLRKLIKNKLQQ